jgi:hypothetical protein
MRLKISGKKFPLIKLQRKQALLPIHFAGTSEAARAKRLPASS